MMKTGNIKDAIGLILEHERFLILAHKNPDGDAIGSTAALAAVLERLGKRVRIMYPNEPSERLKFILQGREYLTSESEKADAEYDLIISLDSAAADRLGPLEAEYAGRTALSIDHHAVNTPFAALTVCDPNASATCELIFELAKELKTRGMIADIGMAAYPLYAGISSDTGSFKYSNTSPKTLRSAAELLEYGIDAAEISRLLFDTVTFDRLRAEGEAVRKLRVFANGKAAIVTVTDADVESCGLTYDDFDDSVNIARRVAGVEIGAYMRRAQDESGKFKVSLRSNSYIDVAAICKQFGGGGHIRAAGCAINSDSYESAEKQLCYEIEKALETVEREKI